MAIYYNPAQNMVTLVVGEDGCGYNDVVKTLLFEDSTVIVLKEWRELARQLKVPAEKIETMRLDMMHDKQEISDVLHLILVNWKMRNASSATLEQLVKTLREISWENIADRLEKKFQAAKKEFGNIGVKESISYYIPRRLLTQNRLNSEIFSMACKDVFVFTGIDHHELTNLAEGRVTDSSRNQAFLSEITVRFIVLEQSNDWKRLTSKSENPIHLIRTDYEKQEHIWLASKGDMTTLQKVISSKQVEVAEDDFVSKTFSSDVHKFYEFNQPVCISDTPGMGKSVLLNHIGEGLKQINDVLRVILVTVGEWIANIQQGMNVNEEPTTESVINGLIHTSCQNDATATKCLKNYFNRIKENLPNKFMDVQLLLDGFDEVNSSNVPFAARCLSILVESTKAQARVWVTTRPHLRGMIENTLGILGYNILPFATTDQIKFLQLLWTREKSSDFGKLEHFGRECLAVVKSKLNSRDEDIAGVPLQSFLIGEAYESEAKEFAETDSSVLPLQNSRVHVHSIMDLYENLIKKKFAKLKDDEMMDAVTLSHAFYAMKLIFPEHASTLITPEILAPLSEILQAGVLEYSGRGDDPKFVHRTFAEYFIASFIAKQMEGNWSDDKADFFFHTLLATQPTTCVFSMYYFKIPAYEFKNPIITFFMDAIIQRKRLSNQATESTLKGCFHNAPSILLDKISSLCLACMHANSLNIFKLLHFASIWQLEEYFTNDFFILASCMSSLPVLQFIFEHSSNPIRPLVELESNRLHGKTVLHGAIAQGDYSVIAYLVNNQGFIQEIAGFEMQDRFKDLLHCCVDNTYKKYERDVVQRKQAIRLLVGLNKNLLNEVVDDMSPLLCDQIHCELLKELIKQGADLFYQDKKGATFLHKAVEYLTAEEMHTLLEAVPFEEMEKMVHIKTHRLESIVHYMVDFMHPKLESLQLLQKCGADFNAQDAARKSPIIYVMDSALEASERIDVWKILINMGASYSRSAKSRSPLHRAAYIGDVFATKFFLSLEGTDVNEVDSRGFTVLENAVLGIHNDEGRFNVAKSLKDFGATLNPKVVADPPVLHLTVSKGQTMGVKILLEVVGVDPNQKSSSGLTALHALFENKMETEDRVEIARTLLEFGADVNIENKESETPLIFALKHKPENLSKDVASMIVEKGGVVSIEFQGKMDQLTGIVSAENRHEMELPNPTSLDDQGTTELHQAIKGRSGRVRFLLEEFPAQILVQDLKGRTPLHLAMFESLGCLSKNVQLLLDHGADINALDYKRQSPLMYSWNVRRKFHSDVEVDGKLNLLKHLVLEKGLDGSAKEGSGLTVIKMFVIRSGLKAAQFHKFVKVLQELGCVSELNRNCGANNATPLQEAVYRFDLELETIQFLASNGGDFNAVSKNGDSVFMWAIKGKRRVSFLKKIQPLCDISTKDNCGNNVMHIAAKAGNSTIINFIMETDSQRKMMSQKNQFGKTPLDLAMERVTETESDTHEKLEIINALNGLHI